MDRSDGYYPFYLRIPDEKRTPELMERHLQSLLRRWFESRR